MKELKNLDLTSAKMIKSLKTDCRGEAESSAIIKINDINTRVACRVLVVKEEDGKLYFLAKKFRAGFFLVGGGFDADKDSSILESAKREVMEEAAISLKDVVLADVIWYHTENSKEANWVKKYVPNEDDRWHAYLEYLILSRYENTTSNEKEEGCNKWYPVELLLNAKSGKSLEIATEAKEKGYI